MAFVSTAVSVWVGVRVTVHVRRRSCQSYLFGLRSTSRVRVWLAMTSLAPCVQQVLLEAAADEARFDEARPLPVAWDNDVDAVAPVGPADVRPVRRRLRAKVSPPVAWQDAGPWQPQRSPVEPAAQPGAARKKPARRTRPNEECPGASAEEPCIFAQKEAALGGPACLDHGRQQQRCVWCDVAELRAAAREPHRRKFLTRALRTWTDHGRQDVVDAAMGRLEPEARALLEAALHRAPRTQAAMAARKAAAEAAQSWGKLLEARVAVDPPISEPATGWRMPGTQRGPRKPITSWWAMLLAPTGASSTCTSATCGRTGTS